MIRAASALPTAAKFCHERHPHQVGHALKERSGGEEVGNLGDVVIEIIISWSEEVGSSVKDGDSRSGSQEVAEKDSERYQDGDVHAVRLRPAMWRPS
ncbi:hypothetical protein HG531_005965 [Fusarium graminearum]|nr:hypothetical protein HG531_005965 [Fusarium graminearum]